MLQNNYDIVIIGSGITGSLIARELSKYQLSIAVLEKQIDVGMCPSSANSAIIHAGHDPKPGSLKAELNVEGNRIWESLSHDLSVAFKKSGSYVVSIGEKEKPALEALFRQAVANGVPEVRLIGREEMLLREPLINPSVSGALWTPSAAVIDPFGAVLGAAWSAVENGVHYYFETEFLDFIQESDRITGVKTNQGDISCRWAINCAGLYSDEVMHKAGVRSEFTITPRRGEYLVFDTTSLKVNNVLFHVPTEKGKGIVVSTTTHGNVMIGPNAAVASSKEDNDTTPEGLKEIIDGAKILVPSVDPRGVIALYAGIRATGNAGKDFVVEIPENVRGFVNLGGIDSPGFVSAPAIAKRVAELISAAGEKMKEKDDWKPVRKAPPVFHKLSHREKAELTAKNPAYGRIVCRCEEITEGEIIDAVHSPVPAKTYDGIKRRTWLGTGRCQGAFDYPRTIEILARELNIPAEQVTKKGPGSEIVFRKTKEA